MKDACFCRSAIARLDGRDDGRELAAEEAHEDADQDAEELLGVVGLERLPERQSALDRQDGKRRQRVDRRAEVAEGQRRDLSTTRPSDAAAARLC